MLDEVHPVNEEAWQEWVEFRSQEKKKKIGPRAEQKQRQMLSRYNPAQQQQIIDSSIMNSWQGLFPPKGSGRENTNRGNEPNQDSRRLSAGERIRQQRAAARLTA